MKENVNDARTLLGALTSIGSRVDRDQGQLRWGSRERTVLSSEMFSALYVCTGMLNGYCQSTRLEMLWLLTRLVMLKEGSRSVSSQPS
jgi:hypothetical protein